MAVCGLAVGGCAAPGAVIDARSATEVDATACAPYRVYGSFPGQSVSLFTSILAPDDRRYIKSFVDFEKCTGIKVAYEGSNDFEAALDTRIEGGYPPDLAFIPQPGLLATLVKRGVVKPETKSIQDRVSQFWSQDWKGYGMVDGTLYAAPAGASVKSFIWYSPRFFASNGLTPPKTWDALIALSDRLARGGLKGTGTDFKPWCDGFSSGTASGWPGTDWIEDLLLRTGGAGVYDRWVTHQIPFNDPHVLVAFARAGQILKNPKYVNGGTPGGVASINTVTFQAGGLPVLRNQCAMHRQASFYAAQWPSGTNVAPDGDVYAFPMPPVDLAHGQPILGAGEFVAGFSDRPAVQALQAYLASADWANNRASFGGWVSANKGLKVDRVTDPIQRQSAALLQDPKTVFRFDGSDMMPAQVGSGTFWQGMVNWINGRDAAQVTSAIEASWPPG